MSLIRPRIRDTIVNEATVELERSRLGAGLSAKRASLKDCEQQKIKREFTEYRAKYEASICLKVLALQNREE